MSKATPSTPMTLPSSCITSILTFLGFLGKEHLKEIARVSKTFRRLAYTTMFQSLHLSNSGSLLKDDDHSVVLAQEYNRLFVRKFDNRPLLSGQAIHELELEIMEYADIPERLIACMKIVQNIVKDLGWIGKIYWQIHLSKILQQPHEQTDEFLALLKEFILVANDRTAHHHVVIHTAMSPRALYRGDADIAHEDKVATVTNFFNLDTVHVLKLVSVPRALVPIQLSKCVINPNVHTLRLEHCSVPEGRLYQDHAKSLVQAVAELPGLKSFVLKHDHSVWSDLGSYDTSLAPSVDMVAHPNLPIEHMHLPGLYGLQTLEQFVAMSNLHNLKTLSIDVTRVLQKSRTIADILLALPQLRQMRLIEWLLLPEREALEDDHAAFEEVEAICARSGISLRVLPRLGSCMTASELVREFTRIARLGKYITHLSCYATTEAVNGFESESPRIFSPFLLGLELEIFNGPGRGNSLDSTKVYKLLAHIQAPACTRLRLRLNLDQESHEHAIEGVCQILEERAFPDLRVIGGSFRLARIDENVEAIVPSELRACWQEIFSLCDKLSIYTTYLSVPT